ncbi:MAG TPA: hypothetical protein VMF66_06365 [Candidatus Acidoferrum sp.]|nr:hypothetical protein [Candidatus Acidoferrum sp.]
MKIAERIGLLLAAPIHRYRIRYRRNAVMNVLGSGSLKALSPAAVERAIFGNNIAFIGEK